MLQCLITIVLYYRSASGSGIDEKDENNDLLTQKLDV